MSVKIYLHLLFFCGILCLDIFATLADKDTSLSSDFLVRKKRVINHLPEGRISPRMESVYYIVRIKEGSKIICAGAILSHYTVITAASCVLNHDLLLYQIYSGWLETTGSNMHNVTSKVIHRGNPPYHHFEGIALITVDPPFTYSPRTGHIDLYEGSLPVGSMVNVFGWGNTYPLQPGSLMRKKLRKINLPIINRSECRAIYAHRFNITDKHICTYHEQQYCACNDEGAPLVFNHRLAGIHVWKGNSENQRNPDIFINLALPEYIHWIRANSILI